MDEKRILWVDLLRTISMILVVGFHVGYELIWNNALRPIGFIGISLFFIISGFILAKKYPNLINFDFSWIMKRYVNIASLYYPALIVIGFLFGAYFYLQGVYDLLLHFLFLNFISHDTLYSIISPAWFVIPLIGLYLLFPFLNNSIKKYKWFMVIAVLLTLASRILENSFTSVSPIFFFAEFCFGISFAYKNNNVWLNSVVLIGVINPVMILPFIIFWLGSLLEKVPDLSVIGQRTFEIFLFHESVMKVLLGEWKIFGLGYIWSVVLLVCAILITIKISEFVKLMYSANNSRS